MVSSGDTAQGSPAWESGRCSSPTPCSVRAAAGARVYFLFPSMVSGTLHAVLGHTNEGQECRSHAFQGWWISCSFCPLRVQAETWVASEAAHPPAGPRQPASPARKVLEGRRQEWCDRQQSRAEDHFQKWVSGSILAPLFSQQHFKPHCWVTEAGQLSWTTVSAQNGAKERVARAEGREMGSETESETREKLVSVKIASRSKPGLSSPVPSLQPEEKSPCLDCQL